MASERHPVHQSIREVGSHQWLIADKLLLTRQSNRSTIDLCWSDGEGGYFVLVAAAEPVPNSRPLPENSMGLPKVHDAGGVSSVWRAGEAFIKAHTIRNACSTQLLFHDEINGRDYLVLSKIPGSTLDDAWRTMDKETKTYYASRVAEACRQLAAFTSDRICGVGGLQLDDLYLGGPNGEVDHEMLLKNAKGLGMDCATLVLSHCDLGPANLIVNPATRSLGIIDWETAGFVPRDWIRTKIRVSGGMVLQDPDLTVPEQLDWKRRLSDQLAKLGFSDVAATYLERRKKMLKKEEDQE